MRIISGIGAGTLENTSRDWNIFWGIGRSALLAFALLVFFTGAPGFAQVAGLKQLTGHVPEAVSTAPWWGDYPPANRMILALGLPLRTPRGSMPC